MPIRGVDVPGVPRLDVGDSEAEALTRLSDRPADAIDRRRDARNIGPWSTAQEVGVGRPPVAPRTMSELTRMATCSWSGTATLPALRVRLLATPMRNTSFASPPGRRAGIGIGADGLSCRLAASAS